MRDLLAKRGDGYVTSPGRIDEVGVCDDAQIYTTNLWYLRLCRSVVASAGGQLTGALDTSQRRALGRELLSLPSHVTILPVADLAWQMAERHTDFALSALSCEALVVAERLDASICVWLGDDGPNLRAASQALGIAYRTIVNGP